MTQREIKLDDDDNQLFASTIAQSIVYDSEKDLFDRCYQAILEMLDHPWMDEEVRNEVVKSAARTLGIKIIV